MTKGSSLLEPGQKVTKPNVDDRIAAQLVRDLYGLEASGIKVENTSRLIDIDKLNILDLGIHMVQKFSQPNKSILFHLGVQRLR